MKLTVNHVGTSPLSTEEGATYRDRISLTIPLASTLADANLEIEVVEQVVDAGTPDAHFLARVYVRHRSAGWSDTLLAKQFRTDERIST